MANKKSWNALIKHCYLMLPNTIQTWQRCTAKTQSGLAKLFKYFNTSMCVPNWPKVSRRHCEKLLNQGFISFYKDL